MHITKHQLRVLRLIADGLTEQEIARKLHLSISTVKTHKDNVYLRLGAKNAPHAVHIAWSNNLFHTGEENT